MSLDIRRTQPMSLCPISKGYHDEAFHKFAQPFEASGKSARTLSPILWVVTALPTAVTIPAQSYPGLFGKLCEDSCCEQRG